LYQLTKIKKDNTSLKQKLNEVKAENHKLLHSLKEKKSDYDTLKFTFSIPWQ
jgi:predicted nuclease with TOPRIM domain